MFPYLHHNVQRQLSPFRVNHKITPLSNHNHSPIRIRTPTRSRSRKKGISRVTPSPTKNIRFTPTKYSSNLKKNDMSLKFIPDSKLQMERSKHEQGTNLFEKMAVQLRSDKKTNSKAPSSKQVSMFSTEPKNTELKRKHSQFGQENISDTSSKILESKGLSHNAESKMSFGSILKNIKIAESINGGQEVKQKQNKIFVNNTPTKKAQKMNVEPKVQKIPEVSSEQKDLFQSFSKESYVIDNQKLSDQKRVQQNAIIPQKYQKIEQIPLPKPISSTDKDINALLDLLNVNVSKQQSFESNNMDMVKMSKNVAQSFQLTLDYKF